MEIFRFGNIFCHFRFRSSAGLPDNPDSTMVSRKLIVLASKWGGLRYLCSICKQLGSLSKIFIEKWNFWKIKYFIKLPYVTKNPFFTSIPSTYTLIWHSSIPFVFENSIKKIWKFFVSVKFFRMFVETANFQIFNIVL